MYFFYSLEIIKKESTEEKEKKKNHSERDWQQDIMEKCVTCP